MCESTWAIHRNSTNNSLQEFPPVTFTKLDCKEPTCTLIQCMHLFDIMAFVVGAYRGKVPIRATGCKFEEIQYLRIIIGSVSS